MLILETIFKICLPIVTRFSLNGGRRKYVAEIFLEFKEKFLLYGQFCAALPKAQQTLDAVCGKSDAIREDVSRCEQVRILFSSKNLMCLLENVMNTLAYC